MSKGKLNSVGSEKDRYECLRMDNQAYVNMPEQEDYLNPVSSDKGNATPPPPPPEKDPPKRSSSGASNGGAPLPPKRDQSSSTDKFTASNNSLGSNVSIRYPKMGNGELTLEKKREKEKVLLRQKNSAFDSGVGDLEHVHVEGMNQNKNYDYADYGHQYEELPSRKSIAKYPEDSGMDSRSEFYQSSGGATDIVSDAEDTANIVNGRGEKRKRVNPLYDAMTQSMPSIYNKTKQPVDDKLRSQVLCLKITVIVLLVLTVSALAASIYTVISHSQSKDDPDPLLTPKVQRLSEDFSRLEELLSSFDDNNDTMKVLSDLIKKVNEIDANVSSQTHSLYEQIVSSKMNIDRNSQAILDSHANVSQVISDLNTTLQLQIYNFSKQEGPRGPQGVANFSRCWYYNVTGDSAPSDLFASYSAWAPTEIELERSIPLFATCTVTGGTEEHIEVHAISSQKVQYRCRCAGVVPGQSRRNCTVHILICPRQS